MSEESTTLDLTENVEINVEEVNEEQKAAEEEAAQKAAEEEAARVAAEEEASRVAAEEEATKKADEEGDKGEVEEVASLNEDERITEMLEETINFLKTNNNVKNCKKLTVKMSEELNNYSDGSSNYTKLNEIIKKMEKIFHIKDCKLMINKY